ncbi:hypothetical protein TcasGA2_TC034257 [Tribolium castaneum]|uniref:Uncharacterized protein n=1 Tax=Tribolium castaneum TaxID=7070 RepID=A0A139WCK6_TRICA|nr:hypothetical protein TcasGA2_TC034257 [Tribolium castaneum]
MAQRYLIVAWGREGRDLTPAGRLAFLTDHLPAHYICRGSLLTPPKLSQRLLSFHLEEEEEEVVESPPQSQPPPHSIITIIGKFYYYPLKNKQ